MKVKETYTMGRVCKHLECLHSIRLKRAVEYKEPGKYQPAFDFIASQLVDLPHPK